MWSHDELHVFYNITMIIIGYCNLQVCFQHYEKQKGKKKHVFLLTKVI